MNQTIFDGPNPYRSTARSFNTLENYYLVWFYEAASDELIGTEYVYGTASGVCPKQFADGLRAEIKSIAPDKTPIHIVLDGEPEDSSHFAFDEDSEELEPVPKEVAEVKVTPLRPLFDNASKIRGRPEWFNRYLDEENRFHRHSENQAGSRKGTALRDTSVPKKGEHPRAISKSLSSIFSSVRSNSRSLFGRSMKIRKVSNGTRKFGASTAMEKELGCVDKFCFLQQFNAEQVSRRNWWKSWSSDFIEKSLQVTQLQVRNSFTECGARQAIVRRIAFSQSPLEAGVNAVCQWCSVLFRTAITMNGKAASDDNSDIGIGEEAGKVTADCIHSSGVKEMGLALLRERSDVSGEEQNNVTTYDWHRMDEMKKLQAKLARGIIVFMELLHPSIARNRDMLLNVKRKNEGNLSDDAYERGHVPERYVQEPKVPGLDAAIAVQVELQRSFIALSKTLYPMIKNIIQNESAKWLKHCCEDNYFSLGAYRQTRIPFAEELCNSVGQNFEENPPLPLQKVEL